MKNFVQKVWGFHRSPALKPSARMAVFTVFCLITGVGLSGASWLITSQSIRAAMGAVAGLPFWGAALFLGIAVLCLASLTRSLFFGGAAVSVACLAASFVNYFKMLITSTPLEIQDFALIGVAGNIAKLNAGYITLSRNSALAIIGVILWIMVLWFFSGLLRPDRKRGLAAVLASGLSFVLIFVLWADRIFYTPMEVSLNTDYSQTYVNGRAGFVLGLWRDVIYKNAMDEIYSKESSMGMEEKIDAYISSISAREDGERANVIVILSESFFDVTTLPGVEYESDPVSEFHALQKEGVSGKFYTRSLGYGTCNIELEFLTGINTGLYSSKGALNTWSSKEFGQLPAVPAVLADQGYYTAFIHMFNDSIYNRSLFLPGLGFGDIFFSEDMARIDPAAAAAGDGYWDYMEKKISGSFYSDDYMTDLLIELYEQKKDEGNMLLYAASMENHSSYTADKYPRYDYPFEAALGEEASGALNAATQGIANASKALKKLTDYLSGVSEPTVVVFFGDHRPGLGLETGGNVYSELGMCTPDSSQWTAEQYKELYSTDYLIWANDPALLPAEPGAKLDTSSNYLGLDILNSANAMKPDYWRLIESMRAESLMYGSGYYLYSDGKASLEMPESAREKYDVFAYVLHDAFNERHLTGSLIEG